MCIRDRYKGAVEKAQEWFRLPDASTVFQAEITAVAKAAERLLDMRHDGVRFVKIFIDSQAAILALSNQHVTSTAVKRAVDKLNELATSAVRVSLVWIPAHKGHAGNKKGGRTG